MDREVVLTIVGSHASEPSLIPKQIPGSLAPFIPLLSYEAGIHSSDPKYGLMLQPNKK